MDQVKHWFSVATCDRWVMWAVQVGLGLLLLIALTRPRGGLVIARGPESRNVLLGVFGFTASVVLTQIVGFSRAFEGHKAIVCLFDIGVVGYLTLFNGWVRNKVIGWYVKFTEFKES